ncbi:uncharacterized protein CTRU02_202838 [Colletotrichum truncatum]|uniref:Uncharacterized protein n=1 Tax=Colletotrichum truncatum TaxID=5467 RepID=A0ACC3ZLC6_COLTU|nr:uncharacterized protein CTRU02_12932 [Colletotrichum truncatum]KAF6783916.1 hypothetical protein CTRU02_12932 [Colletotrichum truncatum]
MLQNREKGPKAPIPLTTLPPFSVHILGQNAENKPLPIAEDLSALLPAAYRDSDDNLGDPYSSDTVICSCVDQELDLNRLAEIHDWLWMAGRPIPPRPLHYQSLRGRAIQITERMDMHLVWGNGKIFIKPIPRFLLDMRFWELYLCCKPYEDGQHSDEQDYARQSRYQRAYGFLFSYTALISHESDFQLARDKYLLPPDVEWSAWRALVRELLCLENIFSHIDPRFYYGELRLGRLNKIHYLYKTPFRSYEPFWNQYATFFQDNFAWLASLTVYLAVVLTAMQVGLATDALKDDAAFHTASYGFTVLSILGPLVFAVGMVLIFCYVFAANWIETRRFHRRRMEVIKDNIGKRLPRKAVPV